jgi:hypothetical protein
VHILPRLALALAAALLAAPARADTTDACLRAADEGQVLRDQGKLLGARERFLACSKDACPRLVRADCAAWLADVDARVPSVVLAAEDGDGHDLADVRAGVDGAPLVPGLGGRAVPLDPGPHRFRFERPGGTVVDLTVVVREGDRRRVITARFGAPLPPAPPPPQVGPSRTVVRASIGLGVVAVAGGVIFAALAESAKADLDHLRATCAPGCMEAQVSGVRTREIGANVALGVGIVAVVSAAVLLIVRPADGSLAGAAWVDLSRGRARF